MSAYYNEFDPMAAAWLRELISAGHIAPGLVDERSIADVQPDDLREFAQCHFFAGIGGWSFALRLAGLPDDAPIWTGSCPCQPLSNAGQRKGHADERHLWPAFFRLIAECQPSVVLGEQVASKDGREWFAAVRADLESSGYACGAADLCAAGVGAPHIRQRLFFGAQRVDDTAGARHVGPVEGAEGQARDEARLCVSGAGCGSDRLAEHCRRYSVCHDPNRCDANDCWLKRQGRDWPDGRLADPDGWDTGAEREQRSGQHGCEPQDGGNVRGGYKGPRVGADGHRPGSDHGGWDASDWLYCRDGKWRPVEPGTFPLAHGLSARVGRLRGYGNAIVPQVAAAFVGEFFGAAA